MINGYKTVWINKNRNSLGAIDAVVIATVAANTGVAEEVLAVNNLTAFRALTPETVTFIRFLIHLADVLTLTAVSEPVEQTQG